jgi:hypothetical protein
MKTEAAAASMSSRLPPVRKQLSMVLPEPLLVAMKQRAQQLGLTLTAYVSALVRADLGEPMGANPVVLAHQLGELKQRVERLEEQGNPTTEPSNRSSDVDLM